MKEADAITYREAMSILGVCKNTLYRRAKAYPLRTPDKRKFSRKKCILHRDGELLSK
tara:strand:+ start:296 stop:466 length:171 start_codon:yes stop_codon:yes gene_type:complete